MSKDTSGAAFPAMRVTENKGMTLRDYFAAKAMQGMLVGLDAPSPTSVAFHAYRIADAMIKAKEE
jgi:hypothetical protein